MSVGHRADLVKQKPCDGYKTQTQISSIDKKKKKTQHRLAQYLQHLSIRSRVELVVVARAAVLYVVWPFLYRQIEETTANVTCVYKPSHTHTVPVKMPHR